ncbi:phage portal protein [Paenibacillus sp. NEAU-GSW1]|uniref:phage tail assembly chaperone n=1 Tax=Paenibacillus sp. NEAU-GSW1 TaxID=2682486 RepID=UPI0012E2DD5E|nr:phage portal protein [Paenibacillus sp. NEAU-GSW1]MUT67828.1 phage portal protein [Paenibacillus sp. NEAU-GSW1]
MSDLSVFFAQNTASESTVKFAVSERFMDKEGNPVSWELRSMTESENEECRKSATRKVKGKNGVYTSETNTDEYLAKLVVSSIHFPDLKNAELQKSYGVIGAETLLRKMLRPGEYAALVQQVQDINGFNQSINDLADEVKN